MLFIIFGTLLLTGCASSLYGYEPLAGSDVGYYERRMNENYYEVGYQGDKNTSFETAYDFAILRALEIGKTLGYEYMLVTSAKDKTKSRSRTGGGGCSPNVYGQNVCQPVTTYRRTLPGHVITVEYFESQPKGRFLPENFFLIRSSYIAMLHKYGN